MRPWDIRKFREYRRNGHALFTSLMAGLPWWMAYVAIPLAVGIPLSRII